MSGLMTRWSVASTAPVASAAPDASALRLDHGPDTSLESTELKELLGRRKVKAEDLTTQPPQSPTVSRAKPTTALESDELAAALGRRRAGGATIVSPPRHTGEAHLESDELAAALDRRKVKADSANDASDVPAATQPRVSKKKPRRAAAEAAAAAALSGSSPTKPAHTEAPAPIVTAVPVVEVSVESFDSTTSNSSEQDATSSKREAPQESGEVSPKQETPQDSHEALSKREVPQESVEPAPKPTAHPDENFYSSDSEEDDGGVADQSVAESAEVSVRDTASVEPAAVALDEKVKAAEAAMAALADDDDDEEEETNPFATMEPGVFNPFGSALAADSNPFGPEPSSSGNPFGSPQPHGEVNPFGSDDVEINPFSPGADVPQNPFDFATPMKATSASDELNPFASPPPTDTANPFGEPAAANPFGEAPANPFGSGPTPALTPQTIKAAESTNPFGSPPDNTNPF